MTVRHLDRLLEPGSVVVVGASDRPGSVGATVWRNLRAGGFAGPVMAVNPRHRELDSVPVAARIVDLPQAADLAVICTPPATVPGLVADLGAAGTRAAIVMTAGLDAATRQAVLDAARPHLLRVLGPNCLGLLVPHLRLNASFAHIDAPAGDIAFVSQSGALVTAVLDWAATRGIGFSRLVSLGEHADVDFGDLLDWLAGDRRTRSILLYAESVSAARKFMSAARAAARSKPVIVVKAGRAGNGVAAAASHTGALAGSDIVFDAAFRRAGMLRVDTLADLFMAAETLARLGGASGGGSLVLMTNGGGAGVMAADAAAHAGVPLAPLDEALLARLDAHLPRTWSRANPIDLIGDAPVERYVATLRLLLERPGGGTVLFMHAPTAIVRSDEIARACVPLVRAHPGRVMACWLGGAAVAQARRLFEDAGAPVYDTPEEAVRAFALLATYRRNQTLLLQAPPATPAAPPDRAATRQRLERCAAAGGGWLDAEGVRIVLAAYGLPQVPQAEAPADADAAVAAAQRLGFPVALKIRSPDLTHKSDIGGVALNLADAAAVRAEARAMLERVRAARPGARIEGFALQPMVQRPHARELIAGATIDAVFGPVLLFGQGGTAVEVLADRAIALPPLDGELARELVARTRAARLLGAWRDHAPADQEALAAALVALSRLLADQPLVAELDINPLLADEHGVLALDARIRVAAAPCGGAERFAIRPYPDALEERVAWRDRTLLLRPIRPEDGERHRDFVARLSPEDLRLRFFGPRRGLPQQELARLTQIDYAREMAFVAVAPDETGREETLGVVRCVADPDNVEAEFALVVRSDLQRQGLGRLLLAKLVTYARGHGTQRLAGLVLRENLGMLALARTLGFRADEAGSDADARRMVLDLA